MMILSKFISILILNWKKINTFSMICNVTEFEQVKV